MRPVEPCYSEFHRSKLIHTRGHHGFVLDMGAPSLEVIEIGRALISANQNRNALDVGSGSGRNSILLASLGYDVTAVENNSKYITRLMKFQTEANCELEIINSQVEDYCPTESIDLCLLLGILHFLPTETAERTVASLKKSTAPGGVHIVTISPAEKAWAFENTLSEQGYLGSVDGNGIRSYYSNWQTLSYERYVKRDTHAAGVIDEHPIEKFVFKDPRPARCDIQVSENILTFRADQSLVQEYFASNSLDRTMLAEVIDLFGAPDHISCHQFLGNQVIRDAKVGEAELKAAFWGTTKGYFENDLLVGAAFYETNRFFEYS